MHSVEKTPKAKHEQGVLSNIGLLVHGLIGRGAKEINYAIQSTCLRLKILGLNLVLHNDTWLLRMIQEERQERLLRREGADLVTRDISVYNYDIDYFMNKIKRFKKRLERLQRQRTSQSLPTNKPV